MKWRGRERSSNIEDRRGTTGGGGFGRGGGLGYNPFGRGGGIRIPMGGRSGGLGGIGITIVIGIILFAMGINPLELLTGNTSSVSPTQTTSSVPSTNASEDELAQFVGVVVKETETLWGDVFEQNNMRYAPPKVVLFTQQIESGCGAADASSGPFYCPNDQKVYIDLSFYDQLRQRFGAPGDFAQAYVIAHEIGHHVQNLTGVLPDFNARRAQMSQEEQNAYSVRVELQADCYAGVWANYANRENLLEQGDVEEAINAANQIGDDTLTRGTAQPRNFTHGTSAQRMEWLKRGMQSGDVGQCDTFANGAI
jgi:predicted metalloprotease